MLFRSSACSDLEFMPSFRDVILHFELLGRLTMDFPSQTPVIFSPFPVSRVPFLFLLYSLAIPVSCSTFSIFCSALSALRSPLSFLPFPFSVLRSSFSVLHSPFFVLRSPLSALRSPPSALRPPSSVLRSPFSIRSLTDHYVSSIYSLFHNVN